MFYAAVNNLIINQSKVVKSVLLFYLNVPTYNKQRKSSKITQVNKISRLSRKHSVKTQLSTEIPTKYSNMKTIKHYIKDIQLI